MEAVGGVLDGAIPQILAGVEGVELEGEGPPFRVSVVSLKDARPAQILPLIHWFLDDFYVEETEEGGLASPDVAFNRHHT